MLAETDIPLRVASAQDNVPMVNPNKYIFDKGDIYFFASGFASTCHLISPVTTLTSSAALKSMP